MAKLQNKKVTKEIKNKITQLHLQGIGTNEICSQLFKEKIDLSTVTINKVINEYYDSIGEKRIKRTVSKPKTVYTIEQIEQQLLQQLNKGRPAEDVYRVAQKMNSLTDKLLLEIKTKGYNPTEREEER